MCTIDNPNLDASAMGKRLQDCRLAKGLKQWELCEPLDLSTHYLSDIERGARTPKLATFVRIVNELGVSADLILQDSLAVRYKEPAGELQEMIDQLQAEERARVLQYVRLLVETFKEKKK